MFLRSVAWGFSGQRGLSLLLGRVAVRCASGIYPNPTASVENGEMSVGIVYVVVCLYESFFNGLLGISADFFCLTETLFYAK